MTDQTKANDLELPLSKTTGYVDRVADVAKLHREAIQKRIGIDPSKETL